MSTCVTTKQQEEKITTEKEYAFTDKKTLETFVHEIMDKARLELGDLSVIEYAQNKGAVYTFYTAQNSPSGIDNEAFRFLRDGQQIRGNKQWAAGADQSHSLATAWNSTIFLNLTLTIFLNLTLTIFLNLTLTIFLNLVPFL